MHDHDKEYMLDEHFQTSALKMFATNQAFASEFVEHLNPKYFHEEGLRECFEIMRDYFIEYHALIDKNTLMNQINRNVEFHGWNIDKTESVVLACNKVFDHVINNDLYVFESVGDFCRRQELVYALQESVDIIQDGGDIYGIGSKINDALSIGSNMELSLTMSDMLKVPELICDVRDPSKLIQTPFRQFNYLLNGGMGPGEVHVLMAKAGQGKSTFACNLGAFNCISGKKVVYHASLEIPKEQVMFKYGCRIARMSYGDVIKHPDKYRATLANTFKRFGTTLESKLFVNNWQEGTATTNTIKAWILKEMGNGAPKPDLLIIDWDDSAKPTKNWKNMYDNSGQIYDDFIEIGNFFKCPVFTMAQPRRDNNRGDDDMISVDDISHSNKKIFKATSVTSLNFKRDSDKGFLYVGKNRYGIVNKRVNIVKNMAQAIFEEDEDDGDEG